MMIVLTTSIFGCDSILFENNIDAILDPIEGNVVLVPIPSSSISDSTWTKTPKRNKPLRLFIGGYEGYESVALLKFGKLGSFPDVSLIDTTSIKIQLTVSNAIGILPKSSMLLTMYKYGVPWNEDSLATSSIENYVFLNEDILDTATVFWLNTDSTTEKFSFNVPYSLIQSWNDSSDTNGVIIVSDNSSNFIISTPTLTSGFAESSLPILQVTYLDSDSTTTKDILATKNGYLLSITTGLPLSDPERTYVGGGEAYRGIYKFDSSLLDSIPETARISSAELTLSIDTSRSILPNKNTSVSGLTFRLYYHYLDSTSDSSNSVLFPTPNSDSSSVLIPIDGNSITFNMTNIVQQWTIGNYEMNGLVIWSGSEASQIYRVALNGDGCAGIAGATCVEPELIIYYVTAEGIEK